VRPENIIWILGSGRTGSGWLAGMLAQLPDYSWWNEPLIGYLFGHLYYERGAHRRDTANFILGDEFAPEWLRSLREMVLTGAAARFPAAARGGYLVIKEPHGSIGAPLLLGAVPESRVIFLVRDPRDVAASALHVSWVPKRRAEADRAKQASEDPVGFVRNRARTYRQDIEHTGNAFARHSGPKALIRYEDLRADTLGAMGSVCASLGLPVDGDDLTRAVASRAWENIPEEKKGPGTIRRKATPGGWREDLNPTEIAAVEEEAAEVLARFYPNGA
jgi:hypothetical protein